MSDLKPCPFCGGEAVRLDIFDNPLNRHVGGVRYFGCRKCCVVSFAGMTEAEAIEAWNTRHERTCELIKHAARDEESGIELVLYECGQCGWIVDPSRNERYCPNCGAKVVE